MLIFAINIVAGRTINLLPLVPVLAINEVLVGAVARTAGCGG